GIQSIALAGQGFDVVAIEFNQQLLDELKENAYGLKITALNDDIRRAARFATNREVIVCCAETLSHLESKQEIEKLIADIPNVLDRHGKAIFTFRDYSTPLTGMDRFIPVKSDSDRILTCILDYGIDFVNVTDLLYERTNDGWKQKLSAYRKVRLVTSEIVDLLVSNGLVVTYNQTINRMVMIIAIKA